MLRQESGRIIYHYDAEEVWIEPWGKNAVRVRATKNDRMLPEDWALIKQEAPAGAKIRVDEDGAALQNGKLKVCITKGGKITMYNQNRTLIQEQYSRNPR